MDEKMLKLLTEQSEADPKLVFKAAQQVAGFVDIKDPESVDAWFVELKRKLNEKLHPTVEQKLRAYFNMLTNPLVYQEWQIFEPVANCLMDGVCNTEYVNPPSEQELLFFGYIMTRENIDFEISDEVKKYVQTLWTKVFGYSVPHPWLKRFFDSSQLNDAYHAVASWLLEYAQKLSENPDLELPSEPEKVQAFRMAIPTLIVLRTLK